MKKTSVIILALALGLSACAGGANGDAAKQPGTPVADPVIAIQGMEFVDGTVTVEAGTTVTWEWSDGSMQHNVVFDDFESPLQSSGTYEHTFEEIGTYDYHCQPHSFMTGTIFVVAAEGV
jgi:plastocyanin